MAEEDVSEITRQFEDFFSSTYQKHIYELARDFPKKKSLNVDYYELERFDTELADLLVKKPDTIMDAAQKALVAVAHAMPDRDFEPHVRFFNLPDKDLMIQDISSRNISELISFKGVITKRNEVLHRVKIAIYECMSCGERYKLALTKKAQIPQVCEKCKKNTLKLDEDDSYFMDVQRAEAQELLERVKGGAPAARTQLWFEDDLVNIVTPGDNIMITGVMRIIPPIKQKGRPENSTIYTKYIDVVHVLGLQRDFEQVEIGDEEEKQIRDLAKEPHLFEKLVKSIAPAIYGHDEVKEALVLQLFGGAKDKFMPGGGPIRSDIHVLLIGDPGSAKTRFLQQVRELAPKSIFVSGKSTTGVGLTASAERDEFGDGSWSLKAGALVLASGGIASIDEFDKIDEHERSAMHEVMESQTVSVAKAGIVTSFKAKTAILAAANPKHGRFDPNKLPGDQFDIPPTILSRFDLIFPIMDVMDEDKDTKLAEHILLSHKRATAAKTAAGGKAPDAKFYDPDLIDPAFLTKYVAYARQTTTPALTDEAMEKIKSYYVEMRRLGRSQGGGAVPITPRQIEGLVRLSEASAKARLSNTVEVADSDRAIKITDFVIHKIMMDRETGRIDSDIISTGKPKSHVDKLETIMNIIRQMQKEFDMVEIAKAVEEARANYNIEEQLSRRLIDDLIYQGELYKSKHGFVKVVDAEKG
ncbi:minichromosome maintenance protein MCM [Candidatus Micrarchaeota archaeon]|nr:minichromosome maintenance protein MCM [Candidatus Micrarchaeota archaeon]